MKQVIVLACIILFLACNVISAVVMYNASRSSYIDQKENYYRLTFGVYLPSFAAGVLFSLLIFIVFF